MTGGTVTVGSMIYNALVILVGRGPMSADDFGGDLWAGKKRGRTTSSGGGGDYAAQMFLGRLRKLGYAQTLHTEGSSRWEATPAGRNALAAALTNSGAPGEVRQLRRTASGGGRAVGPRELTADIEAGQIGRRIGWRHARPGDLDDGGKR